MTDQSTRLPSIPVDEFIYGFELMNAIYDGTVQTDDPEDYAMELPDGSYMQLDSSMHARVYLTLKSTLSHLDRTHIFSIISRFEILYWLPDLDLFSEHFNEDKTSSTEELIYEVSKFPLWTHDTKDQKINRLHKFLVRVGE